MADKKISQLTGASTPLAGTEVLPIVQSGSTVKVASDDLTVKNVRSNASTGILQVTGPAAGTTRVMTAPNANFTVARTDASQTFVSPQTIDGSGGAQVNITRTAQGGTSSFLGGINFGDGTTPQEVAVLCYADGNVVSGKMEIYTRAAAGNLLKTVDLRENGNVEISRNNLVIGTAAKGINFSANTPSTGSTSQLLNWYEEGTWTPNQGPGLTVVGAFSSNGKYSRIGRLVIASGEVIGATSVACSAGGAITTNLPITVGTVGSGAVTVGNVDQSSTCLAYNVQVYCMTAITATAGINFTVIYIV